MPSNFPYYGWIEDDETASTPDLIELPQESVESDEEEEDDNEEEEEEEEEEERDEDYVPPVRMERVSRNRNRNHSSNPVQSVALQGAEEVNVSTPLVPPNATEVIDVEDDYRRREQGEASSSSARRVEGEEIDHGEQQNMNDLDGACCPICMEPWSAEGDHKLCCLPCGHLYGKSCVERWIQQCGKNNAKCPQCKKKYTLSAIRVLYASRVVAVDDNTQKKVACLEDEVRSLKSRIESFENRLEYAEKSIASVLAETKTKGTCLGIASPGQVQSRPSEFIAVPGGSQGLSGRTIGSGSQGSSCCSFEFKYELLVDGARIFDMDASSSLLLIARRLPGMGGMHILTKLSLIYPDEREDIHIPHNTKAVKDLHVSPSSSRLALLASLGKKLSILSMERNNYVLTYDLPAPAWSCSWDLNCSHHIYAGLQNGMILVFDMRQTAGPIESFNGLSSHPVHTIQSLVHDSAVPYGGSTLISASSVGPCVWNTGIVGQRPSLIPGMENQGVCISLAYSPTSDDIIATFRPKVQTPNDTIASQPSFSPSLAVLGQEVQGSHVHVKRIGSSCYQSLGSILTSVNDVRLSKSVIINVENCNPFFAYGDEATRSMKVWDLSSLRVVQTLEQHQRPILDVKYKSWGTGLLGYVSEDKLELYSARLS
ncbi:E3 ubiquitin-protein ligase RFWD3 [Macadamia integrifolia]|uniref:E3 ubiquitin-protein ligase RFWD3 n=1 Tax=Macadamia integrifolia TaxID=60698 RepID=UPI001C529848|nr:E3 ubiquitin-protein ligase RFWD3 [Macadamia integrifolia]